MLKRIIQFSLQHKWIISVLGLLLFGYGAYTLANIRYDVFPEFAPPQVVIQTEAPGLSADDVALLVTRPIENAIRGATGIERMNSATIQGLSLITVTFQPESDIYKSRQAVAERLSAIQGFPKGIGSPRMTPLSSSTSVILQVGLTSKKLSLMELRTLADWTIKQQILAVQGVSKVSVFGGEIKQYQIQLQPDRLVQYNLSAGDVLNAAREATGIRGAGFIETDNQRIVLKTEGKTSSVEKLQKIPLIYQNGNLTLNLTLGDVAKIVEAPEPPIGGSLINGDEGVVLVISSQLGANTLEVTRKLNETIEELRPMLETQGVELHTDLFRPANFIHASLKNIRTSLILGVILVVVVLFLFLFNLRVAAISCTAIPLSLLGAVLALKCFGLSLNTLSLGGLAIAIGEVVDDAVIDVENIFRRLRQNRNLAEPRPVFQVILDASLEVRGAVVYATFAVILVFLPILTLSGVAGRLFSPLALAYIFAVLTSLLVALTVTPALGLIFLGRKDLARKEPPLIPLLKERYCSLLRRIEKSPRHVLSVILLLTVIGLILLPLLGRGFLPELQEGHFIVHMSAVPGTSLAESLRIGRQVAKELLKIPAISSAAQRTGRAEQADDVFGSHYSEIGVELKPLNGKDMEEVQSQMRNVLSGFPGVNFAIKTFLTERIEETISGFSAQVVINVFGGDLDAIDEKASEIAKILRQINGATEVQIQSPLGLPQMTIHLKQEALDSWGFDPVRVLDAVSMAYQGSIAGQVYDKNRVFDICVILDPQLRKSPDQIGLLPLRSPTGSYVQLKDLASIEENFGRYAVLHEGGRPVQVVTCNVAGRDAASFVAEAKRRILASISLPPGVYLEFGGTAKEQARSTHDLLMYSLLAFVGIILLLSIVLKNYRNVTLVLLNLPFALVGGVLAVFLTGGWLSLGSLIGFVTLFGITLRNSIMMISHYEHLVSVEGMSWGMEAVIQGASERLTPILMTAMVTAMGLIPLAVGSGSAGREIEGPMAIVILGGLITSTLINLIILPTLSLRYGSFANEHEMTSREM